MSTPGWYPDPGGRPGQYRLWDGRGWGLSTTADPPGAPSPDGPPRRRRRVAPWVLAASTLVVVLVVVGALVLRPGPRPGAGPAAPSSSVGGEDPTPSAASSGPSSPAPSETPTGVPSVSCPIGDPFARQEHPEDGRLHGGGLSIPLQPGFYLPGRQAGSFTWAYDLGETDLQVEPNWFASYAVGAVSVADGFEDPRSGAELMMRCTATSTLYRNVESRTDLVSEATTVDGRPAWTIRAEIRADDDRTSFDGDTVQVTVVDLGSPEALAFFWGCAPLGAEVLTARLDLVAGRLEVD